MIEATSYTLHTRHDIRFKCYVFACGAVTAVAANSVDAECLPAQAGSIVADRATLVDFGADKVLADGPYTHVLETLGA
jgi:hypothetical protein